MLISVLSCFKEVLLTDTIDTKGCHYVYVEFVTEEQLTDMCFGC